MSKSIPGPLMAYLHFLTMPFRNFSTVHGDCIVKNCHSLNDFRFKRSSIFNKGFRKKPSFIMLIMNKLNWRFFVLVFTFKVRGTLGMMENSFVDFLFPLISTTTNSGLYAIVNSEEKTVWWLTNSKNLGKSGILLQLELSDLGFQAFNLDVSRFPASRAHNRNKSRPTCHYGAKGFSISDCCSRAIRKLHGRRADVRESHSVSKSM